MALGSTVAAAQPAPRYRNNGLRIAGIVLTSVASALLASGLVLIIADQVTPRTQCQDACGFGTAIGGIFLIPISAGFAGAGIPMWVVGAQPPRQVAQVSAAPWPVPEIVPAGPRGGALRWTF